MEQLSLMYPAGKTPNTITLSEETCNDLSLDYIFKNPDLHTAPKR